MFDPDAAVADALAKEDIVVPPYPAVAVRLNRLINSDSYTVASLSEIIATDPAMSARVVGVSNSARFARPAGVVTTVEQAVSLLGAAEVAQIAMAGGLSEVACTAGPLSELKHLVWRQSVYTALASKQLARGRGVDPAEALLCGLLIGLGRTVTLACIERVINKSSQAQALTAAEWMAIVERQQSTVGVYIAHKWEVPSVFVAVLSSLGSDEETKGGPLGELVSTVAECVQILESSPIPDRAALRELLRSELECDEFLAFAPGMPALLSAVANVRTKPPRRRARKARHASMVLPESSGLGGDLFRADYQAVVARTRGDLTINVEQLGQAGAVLVSNEPLRPNWATRLVIEGGPTPLDLWVNVKASSSDGDVHRIEVQPFALGGDAERAWRAAVAQAKEREASRPEGHADAVAASIAPPSSREANRRRAIRGSKRPAPRARKRR